MENFIYFRAKLHLVKADGSHTRLRPFIPGFPRPDRDFVHVTLVTAPPTLENTLTVL
jgi:hypothetical protein